MRNKYDIYSLDTSPSESQRREKIKNDIDNQKRETFNVRSLFRYLIIWFVIGACSLFVIKIAIDNGTKMVIQKLDPFRDFSDLCIQGERCFNIGDYDNAIKHYTEAIAWASSRRRNSMVGITCFYRGNCYLAKDDFKSALADFEQSCKYGTKWNEAHVQRIKVLLYFAENFIRDNNISDAVSYYEQALDSNEPLYEWKEKILVQRRILIYKSRISYLPKSVYEEIIKADSIWLEINNDHLNYVKDKNNFYPPKPISVYLILDSNFDLSNAEWNYDQGDYKSAISYLENVIKKDEYKKIDQTTQEKFQTLIQLLQSIDNKITKT